jgi:hypothetical protein
MDDYLGVRINAPNEKESTVITAILAVCCVSGWIISRPIIRALHLGA